MDVHTVMRLIETDRILLSELGRKIEKLEKRLDNDKKDQWKIISDLIKEVESLKKK